MMTSLTLLRASIARAPVIAPSRGRVTTCSAAHSPRPPAPLARRALLLSTAAPAAALALALAPLALAVEELPRAAQGTEALPAPVDPEALTEEDGWVESASGVIYRIDKEGEGDPAYTFVPNPFVKVEFEGYLARSGKKIASTFDDRRPFGFQVGIQQRVTPGFDESVYSMKVGEKRSVFIPGEMGFGPKPPPGVSKFADLYYTIELLSLQPY